MSDSKLRLFSLIERFVAEPQLIGPLLRHAGRMAERVYAGLGVDDLGRLVAAVTAKTPGS
jgi:hypothetical protein